MPKKMNKFSRAGAYNVPRKNIILFLVEKILYYFLLLFLCKLKYFKDKIIFYFFFHKKTRFINYKYITRSSK